MSEEEKKKIEKKNFLSYIKKGWHFLWYDDSLLSWISTVILAFVVIKYIIYPVLGAALGTAFPIVAVVSPSMEHDESFDLWWTGRGDWYEKNDITKEEFREFRFKNGFNKGDIIFLKNEEPKDIMIGDVVVFLSDDRRPRPDPIIHRIVAKWKNDKYHYTTKGDNNGDLINRCDRTGCLDETDILEDQILGKALFRIPYLGWVKIAFVSAIANPYCSITSNGWPCRGI